MSTVKQACELVVDCPHSTPVWTNSGALVFRSANIRSGRLDLSTRSFTTEAHYQERVRRAVPTPGDLIITREAPMGEVAIIPPGVRGCLGQRMVLLRPNPRVVDGRFMLYALMSPRVQHEISVHEGTGSTVSNLRIPALEALQFPLPPLAEQRTIASTLGSLDDKIELNRRMNETLEAMARALFTSWFVDFAPVRAKMEGRDSTVMDSEIAALSPDSFEDSELGSIPTGWRARSLATAVEEGGGDIQTGPFGSQLHASDYRESGTPVVMPTNISSRRINSFGIARIGPADIERLQRHVLQTGDLVYSRRGDVEKHALVGRAEDGWLCGTGCLRIRPGVGLLPLFLSLYLDLPSIRNWIAARAVGATMPNLNTQILGQVPLLEPPPSVQAYFCKTAGPLDLRMQANNAESVTLAALRDLLLPRLLSGELRIKDADKLAEAAL
ncbi:MULTISPECIES: restriction endonuclease subunit S [Sorangium]|uniref:restriction endonuclease subunit S n=1 Tax=Sorangium TaxID=39643 RepID=UPI003D9C48ED